MTVPLGDVLRDVTVTLGNDLVATVEMHRPPNNFFDIGLIRSLADAYEALDADAGCRAIVLCSEGRHFCAGANFTRQPDWDRPDSGLGSGGINELYDEAARLFDTSTPVVAAIQGAAIGGGLGLACSADFRVACPEARFSANFARLGFHQGFALSVTLPAIIGQQHSWDMLYTGRRLSGEDAWRIGLCDHLIESDQLISRAHGLAADIAASAPLAVASIRKTMRSGISGRIREALGREATEQQKLLYTTDFSEGVKATAEHRLARFEGT